VTEYYRAFRRPPWNSGNFIPGDYWIVSTLRKRYYLTQWTKQRHFTLRQDARCRDAQVLGARVRTHQNLWEMESKKIFSVGSLAHCTHCSFSFIIVVNILEFCIFFKNSQAQSKPQQSHQLYWSE
jgi:hypothetical protein